MVAGALEVELKNDTNYDLYYPPGSGLKHDVKTQTISASPRDDYHVSVNSSKESGFHYQDTDYYIFVYIRKDWERVWIVGHIRAEEFWRIAKRHKKGDKVGPLRLEKANMATVKIDQLEEPERLLSPTLVIEDKTISL